MPRNGAVRISCEEAAARATEMEKTGNKADLASQKKSVFVTQLPGKDEDEDVPESSDKLLDNDKKLQRTFFVNKENTIAYIKQELADKRREFETRMEGFAQRRSALEEKRQKVGQKTNKTIDRYTSRTCGYTKMKDRVARFERFIRENNLKRERAVMKYQNENQIKRKKTEECSLLYVKIIELQKRYAYLTKKIERYGVYKKFLNRIIDKIPADYACVSDDKLQSLLLRYQTLNATNDKLILRLSHAGDQLEQLKQAQEEIQGIHIKEKFEITHVLADLVKDLETHTESNQKKEQLLMSSKGNHRERKLELGIILLAIDTIVEKCHESCQQRQDLTVDEKLNCIKEWLQDQSGVVELVQTEISQIPEERQPMIPVQIKISEPESKTK